MSELTHADLVARAVRWLKNTQRCRVVLSEVALLMEVPDAIGWTYAASVLVECKASRGDFQRDQRKPCRIHVAHGLGDFRYYMTPPGLVEPSELPAGWGLLEVHPKQVRVKCPAARLGGNQTYERQLLISALARAEREQREREQECPHECPIRVPGNAWKGPCTCKVCTMYAQLNAEEAG